MDSAAKEVIYKSKAKQSIISISQYIAKEGYPETSKKFAAQLYNFGNSLAILPGKYPICKQPQLAIRKMHCAVFNKTYIFVFKLVENKLIIYNIIHGKRDPKYFSA